MACLYYAAKVIKKAERCNDVSVQGFNVDVGPSGRNAITPFLLPLRLIL
jgi:hypothetical protein